MLCSPPLPFHILLLKPLCAYTFETMPDDMDQFYELNAQCWRCRMYVPRVEMKYHAGQLFCPICYNDVAEGGGRCQLCGKQLDHGENRICSVCSDKEKHKDMCPKCGAYLVGGICPNCSHDGPSRMGQITEKTGGMKRILVEHGGIGIVSCSKCSTHVEQPVWENGRPFCNACAEKYGTSLPIRVVRGIKGILKGNVKEKQDARKRIRIKEKSDEKQEEKEESR
jgi:hypothetical protein